MSIDLPLGVLTTLAILTCALVLGHIRDVSNRRTAEEKGLATAKAVAISGPARTI